MQHSVRNVCANFKVDLLSRYRTEARQVSTTPKLFPKVELSPSKKKFLFHGPSKMMKNAFYFILKALFVLKVFKFLS